MKTSYRFCRERGRLVDVSELAQPADEPGYVPGQNYDEYMMGPRSGTFRRCKSCGDLHDVYNWPDNHQEERLDLRSDLAAPYFVSDNLESIGGLNGVQSMADGVHYTSKAKMRAEYRARGMIEMGNDKPPPRAKPKPDRKAVRESIEKAFHHVVNDGARVENFVKQRKPHEASPFGRVNPK